MKYLLVIPFACVVIWAFWYNVNYPKHGELDGGSVPVLIRIATVDVNQNFRPQAAQYMADNSNVTIFIISLSAELTDGGNFDIKITRDGDTLHAFVLSGIRKEALVVAKDFLNYLEISNVHMD